MLDSSYTHIIAHNTIIHIRIHREARARSKSSVKTNQNTRTGPFLHDDFSQNRRSSQAVKHTGHTQAEKNKINDDDNDDDYNDDRRTDRRKKERNNNKNSK